MGFEPTIVCSGSGRESRDDHYATPLICQSEKVPSHLTHQYTHLPMYECIVPSYNICTYVYYKGDET
jgi:hypothetical protein